MTTRKWAITISNGNFTTSLTTQYEKGSRILKTFFQGYMSYVAAVEDVDRLLQHLVDRKRVQTFQKTLESASRGMKRPNSFSDGTQHGAVRKLKKTDNSRKYKRYFHDMSMANKVPKGRHESDAMYNLREPQKKVRALRQFTRNRSEEHTSELQSRP